jgi:hypothetical protein
MAVAGGSSHYPLATTTAAACEGWCQVTAALHKRGQRRGRGGSIAKMAKKKPSRGNKRDLTSKAGLGYTQDVRKLVIERLKAMDKSRYWLGTQMAGHLSRQAVYQFLAGKHDILSENLFVMMSVLRLRITPED